VLEVEIVARSSHLDGALKRIEDRLQHLASTQHRVHLTLDFGIFKQLEMVRENIKQLGGTINLGLTVNGDTVAVNKMGNVKAGIAAVADEADEASSRVQLLNKGLKEVGNRGKVSVNLNDKDVAGGRTPVRATRIQPTLAFERGVPTADIIARVSALGDEYEQLGIKAGDIRKIIPLLQSTLQLQEDIVAHREIRLDVAVNKNGVASVRDLKVMVDGIEQSDKASLLKKTVSDAEKAVVALRKLRAEAKDLGIDSFQHTKGMDLTSAIKEVQRRVDAIKSMSPRGGTKLDALYHEALRMNEAFDKAAAKAKKASASVGDLGRVTSGIIGYLKQVGNTIARWAIGYLIVSQLINALDSLKSSLIDYNSTLERSEIAFSTLMNGNTARAKAFISTLEDFAAVTPFEFQDLLPLTQKLVALGVVSENEIEKKAVPALLAISDATSALGGGPEQVESIVRALGQMATKGKASAEEITRQLGDVGINGVAYIAQAMGKTQGEVFDLMRKGAIDGKAAADAILFGMANDPDYKGMAEKYSKTFEGSFSNLRDAARRILGGAFKQTFDDIAAGMRRLAVIMQTPAFQQAAANFVKAVVNGFKLLIATVSWLAAVIADKLPYIVGFLLSLGGAKIVNGLVNVRTFIIALGNGTASASLKARAALIVWIALIFALILAYRKFPVVQSIVEDTVLNILLLFKALSHGMGWMMGQFGKYIETVGDMWASLNNIPDVTKKIIASLPGGKAVNAIHEFFGSLGTGIQEFGKSMQGMEHDSDKMFDEWIDGWIRTGAEKFRDFMTGDIVGALGISNLMANIEKQIAMHKPKDWNTDNLKKPTVDDLLRPDTKGKDAAAKKLLKDRLQDAIDMYEGWAKAAEDSAKRQLDALKQVRDMMRDLFGSIQEDLARFGVFNSPLDGIISRIEKLLHIGPRALSAVVGGLNASTFYRTQALEAKKRLDKVTGGDGQEPAYAAKITGGGAGGASLDALRRAIIGKESGGRFHLVNPHSGALGYGQVMPSNVASWTKAALGRSMTPKEFLSNREAQIKTINHQLGQYLQQQLKETGGDVDMAIRRVASQWYSGRAYLWNNTRTQSTKGHRYPSIASYTSNILKRYKGELGDASSPVQGGGAQVGITVGAERPATGETGILAKTSEFGRRIGEASEKVKAIAGGCQKMARIAYEEVIPSWHKFRALTATGAANNFIKAGLAQRYQGGSVPVGTIGYNRSAHDGTGHAMIMTERGWHDQYGYHKRPITPVQYVVLPPGARNVSGGEGMPAFAKNAMGQGNTAALAEGQGGDLKQELLALISDLSLTKIAGPPKEWKTVVKDTADNAIRFKVQMLVANEATQKMMTAMMGPKAWGNLVKWLEIYANQAQAQMNVLQANKEVNDSVKELDKARRGRGREGDVFAQLEEERLYGKYKSADESEYQTLVDKTLRGALDDQTLAVRENAREIRNRLDAMKEGSKFITDSTVDEYGYARAVEMAGRKSEYWNNANVRALKLRWLALQKIANDPTVPQRRGEKAAQQAEQIHTELERNLKIFMGAAEKEFEDTHANDRTLSLARARQELERTATALRAQLPLLADNTLSQDELNEAMERSAYYFQQLYRLRDEGGRTDDEIRTLARELTIREKNNRALQKTIDLQRTTLQVTREAANVARFEATRRRILNTTLPGSVQQERAMALAAEMDRIDRAVDAGKYKTSRTFSSGGGLLGAAKQFTLTTTDFAAIKAERDAAKSTLDETNKTADVGQERIATETARLALEDQVNQNLQAQLSAVNALTDADRERKNLAIEIKRRTAMDRPMSEEEIRLLNQRIDLMAQIPQIEHNARMQEARDKIDSLRMPGTANEREDFLEQRGIDRMIKKLGIFHEAVIRAQEAFDMKIAVRKAEEAAEAMRSTFEMMTGSLIEGFQAAAAASGSAWDRMRAGFATFVQSIADQLLQLAQKILANYIIMQILGAIVPGFGQMVNVVSQSANNPIIPGVGGGSSAPPSAPASMSAQASPTMNTMSSSSNVVQNFSFPNVTDQASARGVSEEIANRTVSKDSRRTVTQNVSDMARRGDQRR
jgi:tape measure domain-containing protein